MDYPDSDKGAGPSGAGGAVEDSILDTEDGESLDTAGEGRPRTGGDSGKGAISRRGPVLSFGAESSNSGLSRSGRQISDEPTLPPIYVTIKKRA